MEGGAGDSPCLLQGLHLIQGSGHKYDFTGTEATEYSFGIMDPMTFRVNHASLRQKIAALGPERQGCDQRLRHGRQQKPCNHRQMIGNP